jgi:hypothetical protein
VTRSLPRHLATLLIAATAGCSAAAPRPAAPAPAAGTLTAEAFVGLVRAQAYTKPLGGQASLSVSAPQKQSANIAFVVAPPDSLRVDAQTLFGITLAAFAADGRRFGLFQYGENKYFMGAASSPAVRQIFLVPLTPREFVTLVTGAPSLDGYTLVAGSLTAGPAAFAANFTDGQGKLLTVVVDRESSLVREVFYRQGNRTLHVTFASRRDTPAGRLPERVLLDGGDDLAAELKFGDWNFGVVPDADTFRLPPPPGAEVYLLGVRPHPETP